MKICVAQTRPVKGNIEQNIKHHLKLLQRAVLHGAQTIIFPELSITGYEPELALQLVMSGDDERLDAFQQISNDKHIIIGVGFPAKSTAGICICLVLFHPQAPKQTYFKQYLHADEEPFFASGQNATCLINKTNLALSICYELSVAAHAENAVKEGAQVYIASAVKTAAGVAKAGTRLAEVAKTYAITTLLANCVGESGGYACAGKSAIWNSDGLLAAQLNETDEGILMIDTDTGEIRKELM